MVIYLTFDRALLRVKVTYGTIITNVLLYRILIVDQLFPKLLRNNNNKLTIIYTMASHLCMSFFLTKGMTYMLLLKY